MLAGIVTTTLFRNDASTSFSFTTKVVSSGASMVSIGSKAAA